MHGRVSEPGYGLVEEGVCLFETWKRDGTSVLREKWRIASLRQIDGDGTVPLSSLIGFGGNANVFKRLPEDGVPTEKTALAHACGPQHVPSPNSPWAWARIVEVLQGMDVRENLAWSVTDGEPGTVPNKVNTMTGDDPDPNLHALRKLYYDDPGHYKSLCGDEKKYPYKGNQTDSCGIKIEKAT